MSELFSEDGTTHKWRKITVREVSKYGVFSGPYFPVFGPEKTPYLDTFHAVKEI